MKWLIVILILTIVLIAGCTQTISNTASNIGAQTGIGTVSIEDVVKNSANYENKTVEVIGTLGLKSANFYNYNNNILDYTINYDDDQGYHYSLNLESYKEANRQLSIGEKYNIKGILKYFEICTCESRLRNIDGNCSQLKEEYEIKGCCYADNFSNSLVSLTSNYFDWKPEGISMMGEKVLYSNCNSKEENYGCVHFNIDPADSSKRIIIDEGSFIKEYRCQPNSTEKVYYIEGTEPMVKIS